MKEGNPIPRVRGSAYQREDKLWGWQMTITIGDMPLNEGICMAYPDDKPGFISKDVAVENMREFLPGVMQSICDAYGVDKPDGFIDLKKNQFIKEL